METYYFNSEGCAWECGHPILEPLLKAVFPDRECQLSREKYSMFFRSFFTGQEPLISLEKEIPYIVWSGEAYSVGWRNYPPVADIRSHGPLGFRIENNVGIINISMLVLAYMKYTQILGYNIPHFQNKDRPYCLAYCNSNPVPFRESFFALARSKIGDRVHGLGRCSNTQGPLPGRWSDSVLFETYSQYNFVLAFENCVKPGYITEKILAAFLAGAIPVFWGDDELAKQIFNEKAFLRVSDFSSPEECVNHLMYLESHPEEMEEIRNQPIFKDDSLPEMLNLPDSDYYQPFVKFLREKLSSGDE